MRGISPLVSAVILAAAVMAMGIILIAYTEARVFDLRRSVEDLAEGMKKELTPIYTYLEVDGTTGYCTLHIFFVGGGSIKIMYFNHTMIWIDPEGVELNGDLVEFKANITNANICSSVGLGDTITIVTARREYLETTVMKVIVR